MDRRMLAAALVGSPLWLTYYLAGKGLDLVTPVPYVVLMVAVAAVLAQQILRITEGETALPKWVAALIGLYGFGIAATYIDTFADAVVGLLQFFGLLLGVPKAILGLTVLAWGNSIGDLSTNIAMARKGFANMAITACFAGPVFNMLVGLSFGFLALLHRETHKTPSSLVDNAYPVELSSGLLTGFVVLVINCCLLVGFGIVNKNVVPGWYGYVSFSLYGCYLVISFVLLLL